MGQAGRISFSRIFEDEDLIEAIKKRAEECSIKAGVFILIGTLKNVVLGYYEEGEYKHIRLDSSLEIASCIGNISVADNGEIVVHAHIVASNDRGEAFGGHLMKGSRVGATAELVIIEGKGTSLQRTFDKKSKLNLWKLSQNLS